MDDGIGHSRIELSDGFYRHRILIAHGQIEQRTVRRLFWIWGPWITVGRCIEPCSDAERAAWLAAIEADETAGRPVMAASV